MMAKECDGNHGKQGVNGCIEPKFIDGKWVCIAKLAKPLIDLEQSFLDAHFDAGIFNDWKEGS